MFIINYDAKIFEVTFFDISKLHIKRKAFFWIDYL